MSCFKKWKRSEKPFIEKYDLIIYLMGFKLVNFLLKIDVATYKNIFDIKKNIFQIQIQTLKCSNILTLKFIKAIHLLS